MTDFPSLLHALADAGVEFIVVGGAAATAHGSARLTLDLDVVYRRTPENIARVVNSLTRHHPYLRGAPPGLPFRWDVGTISHGLNFTLATDLGPIDFLGEIIGGGYEALLPDSDTLTLFGIACRCLSLDRLIQVKRATGRIKDLEALADLKRLRKNAVLRHNLFNRVNFTPPAANRSNATFGTITNTYDQRQVQLGVKLNW